jgi:hypothetical protein
MRGERKFSCFSPDHHRDFRIKPFYGCQWSFEISPLLRFSFSRKKQARGPLPSGPAMPEIQEALRPFAEKRGNSFEEIHGLNEESREELWPHGIECCPPGEKYLPKEAGNHLWGLTSSSTFHRLLG